MTHKGVVTHVNERSNEITIYFEDFTVVKKFEKYEEQPIGISIHKWKDERTLQQNAFLWACIKDISRVTRNPDKWQIYLKLLKRYGKFEHLLMPQEALESFKNIYREVEDLGDYTTQSGQKLRQVRAYYGSHTYNTTEMKELLDGVLAEMDDLHIKPKLSKEEMERYGL